MRVVEHPLDGCQQDAERLGVPLPQLRRMVKVLKLSLAPGTPAEGARAASLLQHMLARFNLNRARLMGLAGPEVEKSLQASGRFFVELPGGRLCYWVSWIGGAVADVMDAGFYSCRHTDLNKGTTFRYYFYGSRDLAALAAESFVELLAAVRELVLQFGGSGRVAKNSYQEGLATEFGKRCADIVRARKQMVREAEERSARAAKSAQRQRALEEARGVAREEERSAPPPGACAPACGGDQEDDPEVVFVSMMTAEERDAAGAQEAIVISSDDEDEEEEQQQLAVMVRREEAVLAAMEKRLHLEPASKRGQVQRDKAAFSRGVADASKLPQVQRTLRASGAS